MRDVIKTTDAGRGTAPRRRRRRRNLSLYYLLIFSACALILFVLSRTVLFRINEYQVTGNSKYTVTQILSAGDLYTGKNMFSMNLEKLAKRIKTALIYVDDIKIKRKLPDKLILEVEEADAYACCEYEENRYAIISRNGRYLETEQLSPRTEIIQVYGLQLKDVALGNDFISEDENKITILMNLFKTIDANCPGKISYIDITERSDIVMGYDNRIDIEFGSSLDYEYKLRYITTIIEGSLEPNAKGKIIYHSAAAGASFITDEGLKEMEAELERRKEQDEINSDEPENGGDNGDATQ